MSYRVVLVEPVSDETVAERVLPMNELVHRVPVIVRYRAARSRNMYSVYIPHSFARGPNAGTVPLWNITPGELVSVFEGSPPFEHKDALMEHYEYVRNLRINEFVGFSGV